MQIDEDKLNKEIVDRLKEHSPIQYAIMKASAEREFNEEAPKCRADESAAIESYVKRVTDIMVNECE